MSLAPLSSEDGWMPGWQTVVIALMAIFILALLNLIYLLAKEKLIQVINTSETIPQQNTQVCKLTE